MKLTLNMDGIKEIVKKDLLVRGYDVTQVFIYWHGSKTPYIEATITKP